MSLIHCSAAPDSSAGPWGLGAIGADVLGREGSWSCGL